MAEYQTDSLFESEQTEKLACSHTVSVAFESAVDNLFDYFVPDSLWPVEIGQRIEAPFGRSNKLKEGFCVAVGKFLPESQKKRNFKLKQVNRIIDSQPLLDAGMMELAEWISSYYVCPLGQVLAAMVPSAVKKGAGVKKQRTVYLSQRNQKVIEQLRGKKQKQIVAILQQQGAFDTQSSLELQDLLRQADCTNEPIKRLAEKQIIKTEQKQILKALPAVPEGLMITGEQVILNAHQQKALAHINSRIDSQQFAVTLLHGVTDSGKTELYIRAIERTLQNGRGAIVLLPEIALTAQTVQRFSSRFEKLAVMHSGLSASQRNDQWQKIKTGLADVVIGARSAVFAPLPNLGLIVVDEEHEPGYKQDTQPRYNARDVAIKRMQISSGFCLLGSSTPSLETLTNCQNKKHFSLVTLPKRVMNLPLPEMKLVNLNQQHSSAGRIDLLSEPLERALKQCLEKKEQAILLLNRRGYSSFVFCPSCKHILHCRNCDVSLTFHKSKSANPKTTITGRHIGPGYAVCHYCLAKTLVPEKCPLCGKKMAMFGFGSQRLEEELKTKFPVARIARIDSDSMAKTGYYKLLEDFSHGQIDILAGTQMLAKGLHFPNVTVVGIISADTSLYLPDFRANERTFQLISQVAGRTGRSEKKGTVFVQTFLANQPAIQLALKNDFKGFVNEELKHRKACNLPPFWRLAVVGMKDRNFEKLQTACTLMREKIDSIVAEHCLQIKVRGPIPAVISRLYRFHRMQIIIQAPNPQILLELFSTLRKQKAVKAKVSVAIDIDPVNLL